MSTVATSVHPVVCELEMSVLMLAAQVVIADWAAPGAGMARSCVIVWCVLQPPGGRYNEYVCTPAGMSAAHHWLVYHMASGPLPLLPECEGAHTFHSRHLWHLKMLCTVQDYRGAAQKNAALLPASAHAKHPWKVQGQAACVPACAASTLA